MKILHVLNHSVPHTDGYCVRSANIVRFQRQLGWEPIVVTSPRQEPVPTVDTETINDIRYFRTLPQKSRLPIPALLRTLWQVQRRIEEIIRTEKPNIIHAHSPSTWGYAAARAASKHGVPFVYEVRGVWEDSAVERGRLKEASLTYRMRRALETHVARKAAAMVTISAGLKQEFQHRGLENIFIVPNGVDLNKFASTPSPDNSANSTKKVVIGYIGSLYCWEGVEDLVKAAEIIRKSTTNIHIQIIGDGEEAPKLKQRIKQRALNGTVEMVGRIPHEMIGNAYEKIDILVYPRQSCRTTELVTPLKPLEAMALKKPILVSDVGGLLELVTDQTAAVFEASNIEDLANKCIELANNAILRQSMGERAHDHVRHQRNWSTIIEIYGDVYRCATSATAG